VSHLASSSNGSELFFPGLFVLFALLEESLRDFDVLRDQQISFLSRSCGPVVFTVALGTLDRKSERQRSTGRRMVEGTYVVDGAIMNIGLASSDEWSREDEWVAYRGLPVERYSTRPCFPTPTPASDHLFWDRQPQCHV